MVVDKPAGMSSHDVVARLRRFFGTRKVGHAGTLDPMATGVLVVGIERATKILGHLALETKTYEATIRLGRTTTTDDAEGETTATTDATAVTDEAIDAGVAALTGEIDQVPSAVSAIKVGGRRAYDLVRSGEEVELSSRRVGPFGLDVARTLEQLEESPELSLDLDAAALAAFPRRDIDADQAEGLRHGRWLQARGDTGVVAAVGPDGRVAALVSESGRRAAPVVVMRPAGL